MTKFRNKYRIESARRPNWDYGSNAAYFVTICTHNRQHFFGDIPPHEISLSEIGQIAHDRWHEIPDHFPFVTLGAFVVMPNHIHGIVIIDKNDGRSVDERSVDGRSVETLHATSIPVNRD